MRMHTVCCTHASFMLPLSLTVSGVSMQFPGHCLAWLMVSFLLRSIGLGQALFGVFDSSLVFSLTSLS